MANRIAALLLALCCSLGLATAASAGSGGSTATVTAANGLNLRSAPSTSASILGILPSGATVMVTGPAVNGWYPTAMSGLNGWAEAAYLSLHSGASTPAVSGYGGGTPSSTVSASTSPPSSVPSQSTSMTAPPGQVTTVQSEEIPLGAIIQLPPGAQIEAALAGDFMAAGTDQFAVVYAVGNGTGGTVQSVTVLAPSASGWTTVDTSGLGSRDPKLWSFDLDGMPVIAFSADNGTIHSNLLLLKRWDGLTFATIFNGSSDGSQAVLKDWDGSGAPPQTR